ncbi:MAG: hydroxyacylglutathione hydrolase [Alphaproteobacteria bacterium]|nr:hydroxyacylglutathione hydrolase [Alphaproteobacteria bacterium]
MDIHIIPCLKDNYAYIVENKKTKSACVIDPSEAAPIISFLNTNKVNLKYILNTHHHEDHIGGNLELKKKFNSQILGFEKDKNRIPGIDILLKNKEIWNFEGSDVLVEHVPGHTSGHIFYYFKNEESVFTGDTLFSFGCGRLFEGSYLEMINSLKKIKSLPHKTKVFCGHEYTINNLKFCMEIDKNNSELKEKYTQINNSIKNKLPSVPCNLSDEIKLNVFLKFDDLKFKKRIGFEDLNEVDFFKKIRDLKDNF